MVARLWITKIIDGLFTLFGELLLIIGIIVTKNLHIVVAGLFFILIGQMAGVNAIKYENKKKLQFFLSEVLENIGRQFAYPLLLSVFYLLNKNEFILPFAFALTLCAVVKSIFIFYKAKIIEKM